MRDRDDGLRRMGPLDGFMIGRASFGNPWAFLAGGYRPTLQETLTAMRRHCELLSEHK